MAEYPKKFAKGDSVKTAANKRQEVQLKFQGYRPVSMDITPTTEAPPASHVERVNALTGRDDEVKTQAQLDSEAEIAKLPEAKDAEVVDLTDNPGQYKPTEAELEARAAEKAAEAPKPRAPKRN